MDRRQHGLLSRIHGMLLLIQGQFLEYFWPIFATSTWHLRAKIALLKRMAGCFGCDHSGLCEQKSEERRTAVAQREKEAAHAANKKIKKAQRVCLHFRSPGAKTRPRRSISHPEDCRNFLEKQAPVPRLSLIFAPTRQDAARTKQEKASFLLLCPSLSLSLYAYLYIGTAHPFGIETNKQILHPT